jgi:drug/metabolite transporter (DMT)-like permease
MMLQAPASFAWLISAAAIMEFPRIFSTGALAVPRAHLYEFAVSACLGFAVTALGYATIKLTNSLTLKVLGNVRNVVTILAAVALFGEVVTWLQVLGYGVSIGGFAYYTHLKMQPYKS